VPKSANGEEAKARRGFLAGSGSDGDPLLASSLARFWPGDEATAAEDEGARRPEEVEFMAAGTGAERRWPVAGAGWEAGAERAASREHAREEWSFFGPFFFGRNAAAWASAQLLKRSLARWTGGFDGPSFWAVLHPDPFVIAKKTKSVK